MRASGRFPGVFPVVALALSLIAAAHGEDKDKRRLFNTFFLNGERVTYMLTLNADRTYELYGPDGQRATGKYVPSDKEVAILYAGGMRHFAYDFEGSDVVFDPTKKDQPRGGDLLGSMPPVGQDSKATFVSIANWKKKGRPTDPPGGATPATTPALTAPVTTPAVAAAPVPAQIAGAYSFTDAQGRVAMLRLRDGGTFDYTAADGQKTGGNYLYVNGELSLDSGFWRRHLSVAGGADGLQFSRRDTDVPKLGDPLGEMVPVERVPVAWKRQGEAGIAAGPLRPLEPLPPTPATPPAEVTVQPPVVTVPEPPKPVVTVPEPTKPVITVPEPPKPVVTIPEPPKPVAEPAVPAPGAGQTLAELAGTYTCKPNPLVLETWVLQADGKFQYKDSNGADVSGTAQLNGDVLKLQSGEVVRHFIVSPGEGGAVLLSRAADDNPRILNDLASMSPSVLKSAKYEKQKP
jgi:hypothetical protein